ncbi:hypothetical protein MHYP_G00141110 [Metynnis hypsauchen]
MVGGDGRVVGQVHIEQEGTSSRDVCIDPLDDGRVEILAGQQGGDDNFGVIGASVDYDAFGSAEVGVRDYSVGISYFWAPYF